MNAVDTPEFQLFERIFNVWSDTLSDADKHWLRATDAGHKEMW